MWTKKYLQEFLRFNRRDRMGLIALVLLIGVIYFLPYLGEKDLPFPVERGSRLAWIADSLGRETGPDEEAGQEPYNYGPTPPPKPVPHQLFRFDPNSLS